MDNKTLARLTFLTQRIPIESISSESPGRGFDKEAPPLFATRKPANPPSKEAARGGSIPRGGRLTTTKDRLVESVNGRIHLRGIRKRLGRQNRLCDD